MTKIVSAILTTYNGATRGYLHEAIESVLNQNYKNFELIIVDDGSNDNTKSQIESYLQSPNVKYIYQENKGLAAARNLGIKNSKGEFICFLDDDDIWKPEKLQKQIDFFEKNKDDKTGMVFTSIELINERGIKIGIQSHIARGDVYKELLFENLVDSPSSVMIKKEVFDKIGIFKEHMRSAEDRELWIRIAKKYHIYSINEHLVSYRIHSNKMSVHHKKMEFYTFAAIYYALEDDKYIDEDLVYNNLYQKFAKKHFNLGNYKEFRRYYRIALAYGNNNYKLKLKYLLSYLPSLIKYLKLIKI